MPRGRHFPGETRESGREGMCRREECPHCLTASAHRVPGISPRGADSASSLLQALGCTIVVLELARLRGILGLAKDREPGVEEAR